MDERVFAATPGYVAVVVLAEGIGNGPSDDGSSARLAEAEQHLRARGLERAADDPHSPRGAPRSAASAPSRALPCSAEALATRVLKGGRCRAINRLVDHLQRRQRRHLIPVGGEDLDRLDGPLRLTVAAATSASTRRRRSSTRARARSSGATTPA